MGVKSSEVLRLAAELEFNGDPEGISTAQIRLNAPSVMKYLNLTRWWATPTCSEHAVLALCLAAAIAEDEGD